MNFFGHAIVAGWYRREPGFVLGAMLPDFLAMLRLNPPLLRDPTLLAGVALHHATDAAFHGIPSFVGLTRAAQRTLAESGVGRGPARAAAHVGVELLLDEELSRDEASRSDYLKALRHARSELTSIVWSTAEDTSRFSELMGVLVTRGVTSADSDPERLAQRLRGALAGRPRLAFSDDDEPRVREWVVAARPSVVGCAPVIMSELRSRLATVGFSSISAKAH